MSTVYLSENADESLKEYIIDTGHVLMEVKKTADVYDGIATHPDIYICKICDQLITEEGDLGYNYPNNVKYNAACVGKYFIHNTNYTAPKLLEFAKQKGLTIVHVNQGYTKCNLAIVDDKSVITSDEGIAKTLESTTDIDVLLISNGNIKLKGFPYGFIGGTSGRVGDAMVFHGDLSEHPDYIEMSNFVFDRGFCLQYFDSFELEDIGSIIEV
ncbi:DUF6873 family GME fold protein [Anaerovorax odorimutans]|uniref:DUF6873 family GME fold protein n=1 Tax=Anaerovorax odorimutans TaxID=109327 RepID=UPI0003FC9E1B|nr:hypothetical protein [Anaerovorax odorimutans]